MSQEKPDEKMASIGQLLGFFGLTTFIVCLASGVISIPKKIHDEKAEKYSYTPVGTDAANPAMAGYIKSVAKEYGLSDEEARQAIRKGARQGYSGEEVDRIFGK